MKTATIPSLRVKPELREAAESVLREGETLSSFVEQSLLANIAFRRTQTAFIAKGLASRTQAREDNEYYTSEQVLLELNALQTKTGK